MISAKIGLLVTVTTLVCCSYALAQANDDSSGRRLSVSLVGGPSYGGPAANIEDAMAANGFDDTSPPFFGPAIAHPFTRSGGPGWVLTLGYKIQRYFQIRALLASANLGEAFGYRDSDVGFGNHLILESSIKLLAIVPAVEFADLVRFGAGPSLNFASVSDPAPLRGEATKSTKLGFLLEGSIAVPKRTRFFLALTAQYRYAGSVEIGPYEANGSAFEPYGVSFNHSMIGVGLGVRF